MKINRKTLTLMMLSLLPITLSAQNDLIILRNGNEIPSKVIQVDAKSITYKESAKAKRELHQDLCDVYMIRYEKRGNIYITDEGKRITGENNKWEKGADRIYLVTGKEIQAFNLNVGVNEITYSLGIGKGPFRKKNSRYFSQSLSPQEVFMIKYADGTKDILTDIRRKTEPSGEENETSITEVDENERQVVFHNVKKGETLNTIAKRYDVTVKEIIDWNDLPKTAKATTRLQSGTQLMVYVKPTNKQ